MTVNESKTEIILLGTPDQDITSILARVQFQKDESIRNYYQWNLELG